jgi:hypothetical protein
MARKVARILLIGIALLISGLVLANNNVGDSLKPGSSLRTSDALLSANGQYTVVMQPDCNLVMYQIGSSDPIWATNTDGKGSGCHVDMQQDGNLVVYSGSHDALWDSKTVGNAVSGISMQNDGNLVIYRPDGRALWASNDDHNGRKRRPPSAGGSGNSCPFPREYDFCVSFTLPTATQTVPVNGCSPDDAAGKLKEQLRSNPNVGGVIPGAC